MICKENRAGGDGLCVKCRFKMNTQNKDVANDLEILLPEGRYVGKARNGIPNGKGELTYNEHDSRKYYKGDFKDGMRHGKGKLVFRNDAYYDGEWVNDKYEGYGEESLPGGNNLEGYYTDGRLTSGHVYFGDGREYEGEWSDDMPNGTGKMYWRDGHAEEGYWVNGICAFKETPTEEQIAQFLAEQEQRHEALQRVGSTGLSTSHSHDEEQREQAAFAFFTLAEEQQGQQIIHGNRSAALATLTEHADHSELLEVRLVTAQEGEHRQHALDIATLLTQGRQNGKLGEVAAARANAFDDTTLEQGVEVDLLAAHEAAHDDAFETFAKDFFINEANLLAVAQFRRDGQNRRVEAFDFAFSEVVGFDDLAVIGNDLVRRVTRNDDITSNQFLGGDGDKTVRRDSDNGTSNINSRGAVETDSTIAESDSQVTGFVHLEEGGADGLHQVRDRVGQLGEGVCEGTLRCRGQRIDADGHYGFVFRSQHSCFPSFLFVATIRYNHLWRPDLRFL